MVSDRQNPPNLFEGIHKTKSPITKYTSAINAPPQSDNSAVEKSSMNSNNKVSFSYGIQKK